MNISSKCFQDLQILDCSEMAWLDVTATQFEPNRRNAGAIGNYGDIHPMNPNDLNLSMSGVSLHDDYSRRWRFGGTSTIDTFDRHHALGDNDIVGEGLLQNGPQHRFHFGSEAPPTGQIFAAIAAPQNGSLAEGLQDGGAGLIEGNEAASTESTVPSGAPSQRLADWRTRDFAMQPIGSGAPARGSTNIMPMSGGGANPNDEETGATVMVHGRGPGRRAGHTATAVNRRIYVFGGSCGSDYLNDFHFIDTDPPPHAVVSEPTSLQLLERRLRHFFNDEDFSDVTFVVQGRKVYGHKMVLSIVSDCFRAMFTTGFRESQAMEIEIPDCSYEAFLAVMEYIYTGQTPKMDISTPVGSSVSPDAIRDINLSRIVEILELADRFFLDHLKQICETMLQPTINAETVEVLLPVAQKTNAGQLQAICEHFVRNQHDNGTR